MSEKDKGKGEDFSLQEQIRDIVNKTADQVSGKIPSLDDIVAKVKEGIPEQVTLEEVKNVVKEYYDEQEKKKTEQEAEDKKTEVKPAENQGASETKTKPEDEMKEEDKPENKTSDEEVAKMRVEVKELKQSLAAVIKKAEEERDNRRNLGGDSGIPEVFKLSDWRVDRYDLAPSATRWKEIPTRAGLSKAQKVPIIKKGEYLDPTLAGVPNPGSDYITKADTLDTQAVAGHPISGTPVWRSLIDRVKLANLFDTLVVENAGKFKITQLNDKAFTSRTSVTPALPAVDANNISEREVTIKEFAVSVPVSFAQQEDTQGIPSMLEMGFMQQYGKTLDEEAFSVLKSATGLQTINTGAGNSLPTVANIYAKMLELRKRVEIAYQDDGVFVINRDIEELLLQNYREGAGFAWNPFAQGPLAQMLGAPVVVTGRLDDTSTAADGEICALFGDWPSSAVVGERVNLQIWQDPQTPGYNNWNARGRYGIGVKDIRAFAAMRVGA